MLFTEASNSTFVVSSWWSLGRERFCNGFTVRINALRSNIFKDVLCWSDTRVNNFEKAVCNSSTSFSFFLTLRMILGGKSFNLQLFFVQRPATSLNPDTQLFFFVFVYYMLFIILRRPNPFPSVTGTSCGLIPARRSSEGSISVPSKPSVARMVMTT